MKKETQGISIEREQSERGEGEKWKERWRGSGGAADNWEWGVILNESQGVRELDVQSTSVTVDKLEERRLQGGDRLHDWLIVERGGGSGREERTGRGREGSREDQRKKRREVKVVRKGG